MSLDAFFESYPVLLVAPFTAVMFASVHQDWKSTGKVGPLNYSLWMGAIVPLGWSFAAVGRPLQLAGMILVLVVYCVAVAKLLSAPPRPPPRKEAGTE
jgi:hypothetical protein